MWWLCLIDFYKAMNDGGYPVGKFWGWSVLLRDMALAVLIDICEYSGENSGDVEHRFVLADNSMFRL
ncbi:MAG: hypothetical protein IPJ67_03115 [Candidatus Moraniibacteriota bacterium]|nr:MAG: hypothetical protein IPJ67_03115 [Candidatus Moranbacteria bacterium]